MSEKNLDEISEFECPDCHGTGDETSRLTPEAMIISTCRTCDGTGKLDWIEAIVGKKTKYKTIQDAVAKYMADKVDREIMSLYKQGF